jgi:hypothetical protein
MTDPVRRSTVRSRRVGTSTARAAEQAIVYVHSATEHQLAAIGAAGREPEHSAFQAVEYVGGAGYSDLDTGLGDIAANFASCHAGLLLID